MKNLNLRTILIIVTTIALGIVAVLGAWMLYQTRQQAIAPTAPKKAPAAETATSQCTVAFSLAAATATASPTGTATTSPTGTATASPTGTASPTSSPTSPPVSGGTAAPTSGATSTTKATSKATGIAKGGASASPALPVSGVSWPGILAAVGGVVLLVLGTLLAF